MGKRNNLRSTRHERSLRRKIWLKLPLIGVLLVLIVCLSVFIVNQRATSEEADRVKKSSSKKKKAKSTKTPQRQSTPTGNAVVRTTTGRSSSTRPSPQRVNDGSYYDYHDEPDESDTTESSPKVYQSDKDQEALSQQLEKIENQNQPYSTGDGTGTTANNVEEVPQESDPRVNNGWENTDSFNDAHGNVNNTDNSDGQ